MKHTVFIILLLCVTNSLIAQSDAITELINQLDTASTDEVKAKIYTQLSDEIVFIDAKKGFEYAEQALYFALKGNSKYYEAYAYSCLAYCSYYQSKYNEVLQYLEKDYPIYKSLNDTIGMIFSLSHQGDAYSYLGNNKAAIPILEEALALARTREDNGYITDALNRVAMALADMSEYNQALDYLLEAKELDEKFETGGLEVTQYNLGVVKSGLGNFDEAM